MSEKPKKRLVGWAEYADTITQKSTAYCLAAVFGGGGSLSLVSAVTAILKSVVKIVISGDSRDEFFISCSGSIPRIGLGLIGIWIAVTLFKGARQVRSVALLTKHSAKGLPDVETLPRASYLPPSQQQAELLRAAQVGKETPPEQLLRATLENRQDV